MYFLHRVVMPIDLVIDFMIYPLLGHDVFDLREDEIKETGLYKAFIPVEKEEDVLNEEYYTPNEDPICLFSDK